MRLAPTPYPWRLTFRLVESKPALEELKQEPFNGFLRSAAKDYLSAMSLMRYLEVMGVRSTPNAVRIELNSLLMANTGDYFATILKKLSQCKSDWIRKALTWVSFAQRPLDLKELALMSAVGDDHGSFHPVDNEIPRDVKGDIRQALPGILQVDGGQVRLIDDRIEDILASGAMLNLDWNSSVSHSNFLRCCLLSLSNEKSRPVNTVNENDTGKEDAHICGASNCDLLHYAVQNWPAHCMLAEDPAEDDHSILEFLENKDLMKAWSDAYWSEDVSIHKIRCGGPTTSPLQVSCLFGLARLVQTLLDSSLMFTAEDQDQALKLAARNGHIEAVGILIKHKMVTSAGVGAALLEAAAHGNEVVALELIEALSGDFPLENATSLISFSAAQGNARLVERIILRAGEPDLKRNCHAPLLVAAARGHLSVVSALLRAGSPVIPEGEYEDGAPLHFASESGYLAVVEYLISQETPVNARNAIGQTPLHLASQNGFLRVADFLIQNGATPSLVDSQNRSPLHLACMKGCYEVLKF
jgi:ankyrin repeat protein